jgi:histidinol-phosphatase (PHP family)
MAPWRKIHKDIGMSIHMMDYHVHSLFSIDGRSPLDAYCSGAADHGLREIGFAEHVDLDPDIPGYDALDFMAYHRTLTEVREHCPLPVRCGIEVSYQHRLEASIKEYISKKPCDYVIGSVHEVKGRTMDHSFFTISSPGEYFSEIRQLVSSGLCDIVGHLEYFKQWGPYNRALYTEELTEILQEIIENELVLEVNTAGLRHASLEPYPSYEILGLYRNLGGTLISLGSDAHTTSHLAFQFPAAITRLKKMGFEGIVRIEKRKSSLVHFDSDKADFGG